jgi:nitrous oxidase accessory protein
MNKYKILSLFFVLLITIAVYPTNGKTAVQSLTIKTLYVDDDASPGWYDEIHFKTIMDAINSSDDGDNVLVYNGTYYENVTITKSISLIGENKYSTIIDGRYIEEYGEFGTSIVRIFKADRITVSGFTIQNVTMNNFAVDAGFHIGNSNYDNISNNIIRDIIDAGILISGSNHIISENTIINTSKGIWCGSTNSTLTKNIITNIWSEGVLLWVANNNTITQNNITNTYQGIAILESANNLIKRNNIAHNTEGVFLSLSRKNKFYENNFIESGYAGHVEFKGWSFFNKWRGNYWDNQIIHGLPKILFGRFGVLPIPWFNIDWRPARTPYDI